jgi:hypothetical protein
VVLSVRGVRWQGLCLGLLLAAGSAAACGRAKKPAAQLSAGEAGAATVASAGAGTDGGGGGAALDPYLGQRCDGDQDCGSAGLFCLGPEQDFLDGAGSPAGGLCTQVCANDADCRPLDPSAVCATLGEAPLTNGFATRPVPRLCLLGCSLGAPGGSKCRGRGDLACRPFAPHGVEQCEQEGELCPGGGLCYRDQCRGLACGPRCNSDQDCASGRTCEPITGLCVEEEPRQVPVGRFCNGDVPALSDCGGGICFAQIDEDGIKLKESCTLSCTVGQRCAGGNGACVQQRLSETAVGDIAYCQQLCDGDEDCIYPDDVCHFFDDPEVEERYGGRGVCDL